MTLSFRGKAHVPMPLAPPDTSAACPMPEPLVRYRELRRKGQLQPDPAQQLAVEKLQSLYRALLHYRPETGLRGWLARFGLAENGAAHVPVRLYPGAPDQLYEHGLQRELFLPFVALLEQKLDVLELDSGRDYRLARLAGKPVYHHPLGETAHDALENAFAELTDGASGESITLLVKRR